MKAVVTTTPNCRCYQFSLRTLLAVMTLMSVASAWLAYERNEVRKRQAAIAAIEELGGEVLLDNTHAFRPRWLRLLLGDNSEGEVAGIGRNATDAGLVPFAGLTKLEGLYCDSTQVTDAGLVHLVGLTKLRMVDLSNTQVTDAGLVHLIGLRKLEMLNLHETQVTDEGVRDLRKSLPNLGIAR